MKDYFREWWNTEGSENYAHAMDANVDMLVIIERIFNAGKKAGKDELYALQDKLDQIDGFR